MFDDDSRPPLNRPAVHLLNELESIKGLLADDGADYLPTDIPLLDDMVIDNLGNNANLLNIEQIFDDDASTDATPATAAPPMQFPRFTLDVAISDDSEIVAAEPSRTPVFTPPTSLPPVVSTPSAASTPTRVRPDYSREVLIQELVDEFIPQIEAELHKRLQQLDDTELHHLKNPK